MASQFATTSGSGSVNLMLANPWSWPFTGLRYRFTAPFAYLSAMPRRKKTTVARAKPARAKAPTRALIEKDEFVDSMDPPNHNVPLSPSSGEEVKRLRLAPSSQWPIMQLLGTRDDELFGIFVAEEHGNEHWHHWTAHPPSWMDPELFVRMAKESPEVQAVLEQAIEKNDRNAWKKLLPLLDQVFEEQYLPYVFEQFLGNARDLLAQWLLRNAAFEATAPDSPRKQKRKRKS